MKFQRVVVVVVQDQVLVVLTDERDSAPGLKVFTGTERLEAHGSPRRNFFRQKFGVGDLLQSDRSSFGHIFGLADGGQVGGRGREPVSGFVARPEKNGQQAVDDVIELLLGFDRRLTC